jgi:hypothetical protein
MILHQIQATREMNAPGALRFQGAGGRVLREGLPSLSAHIAKQCISALLLASARKRRIAAPNGSAPAFQNFPLRGCSPVAANPRRMRASRTRRGACAGLAPTII